MQQPNDWGTTQSHKGNKTFSKSEEWDSLFSSKIVLLRFLRSEHKKTHCEILFYIGVLLLKSEKNGNFVPIFM